MEPAKKKHKQATKPISETHQYLLAEWHYTKNNPLDHDPQ